MLGGGGSFVKILEINNSNFDVHVLERDLLYHDLKTMKTWFKT